MSIDDQLHSLNENEIKVLSYKCNGLKYEQIADRLGYSVDWVQLQMSTVYVKLGFNKEMHWTKRRDILDKDVCPRLPKDLKDWEFREEIKENKEDAQMMALVLYDEMRIIETAKEEPPLVIIRNEKPSLPVRVARYSLFGILVCLAITVIAYYAFKLGSELVSSAPPKQVTVIVTTTPPPALTPPTSSPIVPTDTLIPPTDTPLPTFTLAPTNTPKPYYEEGEGALLAQDVYAILGKDFSGAGDSCGSIREGFAVHIHIRNDSGSQFTLRFNTGAFRAVDDVGTNYKLVVSFVPFYDNPPLGTDSLSYIGTSGGDPYICLHFEGKIPLQAKYFLITADWLSGVGPVTFKKDL